LVRLNYRIPDAPHVRVWLKLENLQPIASFKLRAATAAIAAARADPASCALLAKHGVVTASAGNMAQGVAYIAAQQTPPVPCTVFVPDHAPQMKLDAIRRMGGTVVPITFDEWWQIIITHKAPHEGLFVHPVCSPHVLAGNGSIGCEVWEDLPAVDAVITPYGGGALSCGIANSLRELHREDTAATVTADEGKGQARAPVQIYACEVETAAPLSAALAAGQPTVVEYTASWVDGCGSKCVLESMWPLAQDLVAGSLVVTLDDAARAVKLLVERNKIIAEGAGGAAVAAAIKHARRLAAACGKKGQEEGSAPVNVVAVISGGGIDNDVLIKCLKGPSF